MIYISYPHIQSNALVRTSSQTFDSTYALGNLVNGERYLRGKLASAVAADPLITYDLGTVAAAATTATANHLIIARADLLKAQNIGTVTIKAHTSDNYGAATSVYNDAAFASATLYGPNATDYIATFATAAAKQFWYIAFTRSAGSANIEHSKHYIGQCLDLGVGPSSLSFEKIPGETPGEKTTSGALDMMRLDEPKIRLELEWVGVSDALTNTFEQKILRTKDINRFFLYTTTQHHLLMGRRVMHCECLDGSTSNPDGIPNWNTISATFQEIIG